VAIPFVFSGAISASQETRNFANSFSHMQLAENEALRHSRSLGFHAPDEDFSMQNREFLRCKWLTAWEIAIARHVCSHDGFFT
jgi:hypothetical protein